MKKLITLLTMVAATVALTVAITACKKDEPKFNGDFTKPNVELIQSALGVDSALIIDKLKQDGFALDEYGDYRNDSYGTSYGCFDFKDGKLSSILADKTYKDSVVLRTNYIAENNKMVAKNCAFFKGQARLKEGSEIAVCEKSPTDFKQLISDTNYSIYDSEYSDSKTSIMVLQYICSAGMSLGLQGELYDPNSSFTQDIMSQCDD